MKKNILAVIAGVGLSLFLTSSSGLAQTPGSLKWTNLTIKGWSSAALSADQHTLYIGGDNGNIYALNPTNGNVIWSYATVAPVVTAPTVGGDGTIYVGVSNIMYALNPNGTLKWSYQDIFSSFASYGFAAIGNDGTIYYGEELFMRALNPDGTKKWQVQGNDYIFGPAIGPDGTIYFVEAGGFLHAKNPDGSEKWNSGGYTGAEGGSASIGPDGTVYFGGDYPYGLKAYNPNGTLKWYQTNGFPCDSTPVVAPGGLIVKGEGWGGLTVLDAKTGVEKSFRPTADILQGGPAVAADNTVYVGDIAGYIYAFTTQSTNLLWRYTAGAAIYSFPLIGNDGTVYVQATNGTYALYGTAGPAQSSWPSPAQNSLNTANLGFYTNPAEFVQFDGGDLHSAAVKLDGTLWTWGDNQFGELGDGTTTDHHLPAQVSNLSNMVAVACGNGFTLAAKADGTVWAWGRNANGELGDGTTANHSSPQQVSGLSNIVSVTAGAQCSFALRNDGAVFSWGDNSHGQIGDGAGGDRHTPVHVPGLSNVVSIAASDDTILAVLSNGTVDAWGSNQNGEVGVGSNGNNKNTPQQVHTITNIMAVAGGGTSSFAVSSNGLVWAWGGNSHGELGNGTGSISTVPYLLSLTNVVSISTGENHTLAVLGDGTVKAWGANGQGQLGDGTTTERHLPVFVSGVTQGEVVAAGGNHSLLAVDDLSMEAWGDNSNGQLGDGTTTDRHSAVTVSGFNF